jgi:4-alpha-glucanotransferase
VPPDYFSATGQRWGNPLYRWNNYPPKEKDPLWDWWEQRFRINFAQVDTLRIDHFRGFESYWAIPAQEETALNGQWQEGPGKLFFEEMDRRFGGMSIIAEDLGLITPEVEALRRALGYPGMKILLFAFDGTQDNSYLPYNMERNSVVYTGTHDNDTAVGWYLNPEVAPASKQQAKRFANRQDDDASIFHQDLIYLALSSASNLVILPMQDVLGFGNDCRMNTPGTTSNNWQWRCAERFINEGVATWLHEHTRLFGRIPPQPTQASPL